MFKKILVANRGEIALRVIRACRELGIGCVAVYSEVDRQARHVTAADEAFLLGPAAPAQSYLNASRLLEVAKRAGCDAVHPGYGFLAENAAFARRCAAANLAFIGPSAAAIERMGDKLAARAAALAAGVPVVPGTLEPVRGVEGARAAAKEFGFPIAVKAAAGGGGKGLKLARDEHELEQAVSTAANEAAAYFSNGTIYVERYLGRPKHIEVQILGDRYGRVLHLGERDCSLQRRHQKLVEETPACIDAGLRERLVAAAVKLASSIAYDSAGTVECLVEGDAFYFLEMNTRIQVEHTITEAVWGLDLVKAQIRIAGGEPLWVLQSDVSPRGHAIEARANAESPAQDFRPCPGRITAYLEPAGPGIRVDGAASTGTTIPREYDSLVAKLVAWGQDREEARRRMLRALSEFIIEGIDTTVPLLRMLLADPEFVRGDYATPTVARFVREHASDLAAGHGRPPAPELPFERDRALPITVEVNDKRFEVRVFGWPAQGAPLRREQLRRPPRRVHRGGGTVEAPMHGILAELKVSPGDAVAEHQVVAVIEAMKMMNEVVAHRAGVVKEILARQGETVEAGSPLLTFAE